jgi:hypothetical protein
MTELFISYNQNDRETAHAIAAELQKLGVDVWWDHKLSGGEDYRARIDDVLERSIAAAVIWSRHSVESDWVVGEAETARKRKCLIPIVIDRTIPPLDFRQLHTLDFTEWRPGDRLPEPFLRAVGDRLKRDLAYSETVDRVGVLDRLGRKAVQSWYFDFESILFYLIGHGLACFLCVLPMAFFASTSSSSDSLPLPSWMPYFVSVVIGIMVATLYMRPVLQTSKLVVAVPLLLAAAAISVMSYLVGLAMLTLLGNRIVMLIGPTTFIMLLVSAVADRMKRP